MVYSNKFVAVVVCNGQIVRELREDENDVIRLPFGSDYSIRLKNLHSERAVVNIEIDGQDVLDGSRIVVNPNETADVEGFMERSTVHKKFRFIEKTQQISEHRGNFVEDGLIRISYRFEKPKPPIKFNHPYYYDSWDKRRYGRRCSDGGSSHFYDNIKGTTGDPDFGQNRPVITSSMGGGTSSSCDMEPLMRACVDAYLDNDSFSVVDTESDNGITVAGASTHQHFNSTFVGALETQTHSIVIRILGQTKEGKKFQRPKITRRKIQCPTCGNRNNSRIKYCPTCGTNISDIV